MSDVETLRRLYREHRLLLFVGAGLSRSVRWTAEGQERVGVSWEEFVSEVARKAGFEDPGLARARGTDLQILEYYAALNNGNWTPIVNWFREYMKPDDKALVGSSVHQALSALTNLRVVYTTNFDDFLERSFRLHGRSAHAVSNEFDIKHEDNSCEVVKFHGDINNPSGMVISEIDYEKRVLLKTSLDYKFLSDLLNRVVLFLGYSFRDPNVAYLLRLFEKEIAEKDIPGYPGTRRAYIAVHYPSNFEYTLFGQRKIGVVPIQTPDLTAGYVKLISTIGG